MILRRTLERLLLACGREKKAKEVSAGSIYGKTRGHPGNYQGTSVVLAWEVQFLSWFISIIIISYYRRYINCQSSVRQSFDLGCHLRALALLFFLSLFLLDHDAEPRGVGRTPKLCVSHHGKALPFLAATSLI